MKGAARRKVVTSGRLTGGAKVQTGRKPVAPVPEPAYSLYSTDSEDQVTSLHKGLDRCAALLSGILQAETTASQTLPGAVTAGVAKSRPYTSLGNRSTKKLPAKTAVQVKGFQSGQCGPVTPRASHRSLAPAAHSGVKLHPTQKRLHKHPQSHNARPTPDETLSPSNHRPQTQSQPSVLLSVVQSSSQFVPLSVPQSQQDSVRPCNTECDSVPVRDTNTSPHLNSCTMRMSGRGDELCQDGGERRNCSTEKEVKVKTVQYLLEELKTLIAGQGNVAELLLCCLEQAVSLPQVNDGSSILQAGPELSSLHSQDTELRRCMRMLEQQLKEKAETRQNTEMLCSSHATALQEELSTAQSHLQRLQDDLTELRQALQDTRTQLSVTEEETGVLKTELETSRSRLVASERERSELAALAQQRLEEIQNLNRILQSHNASNCATVADSSSDTRSTITQQHREHPAGPLTDHIAQYLMSLEQPDPTERMAAEREGNAESVRRRLSDFMPSHLDVESVQSDWSVRSESTFNTKDEAAFRDGLAALDASIASLQKTIQLDLRR